MELPSKTKKVIWVSVLLLVILMAIALVRPALQGYTTLQELEDVNLTTRNYVDHVRHLEQQLVVMSSNLSECVVSVVNLSSAEFDARAKLVESQGEVAVLKANMNTTRTQHRLELDRVRADANRWKEERDDAVNQENDLEDEVEELEDDYSELVQNLANNKCCKAQFDDDTISHYRIDDNNIFCESSGDDDKEIEC